MKLHEYEPTEEQSKPRAVHREGSSVLTCAACGCRLIARESLPDGGCYGPDAAWRHYHGNTWDTDARGCRVKCVDRPHRIAQVEQFAS
jgi:hypothetical protein